MRKQANFRLSDRAHKILVKQAKILGTSKTTVLELALREYDIKFNQLLEKQSPSAALSPSADKVKP